MRLACGSNDTLLYWFTYNTFRPAWLITWTFSIRKCCKQCTEMHRLEIYGTHHSVGRGSLSLIPTLNAPFMNPKSASVCIDLTKHVSSRPILLLMAYSSWALRCRVNHWSQVSRLVAFIHADERPIFSGFKSASVAAGLCWRKKFKRPQTCP